MKRDHQCWFSAGRAQRCPGELYFASRVTRNRKLQRTDAHSVQSLRVVETKEAGRHAVICRKLSGHGSSVSAGALNAAHREHIRE